MEVGVAVLEEVTDNQDKADLEELAQVQQMGELVRHLMYRIYLLQAH